MGILDFVKKKQQPEGKTPARVTEIKNEEPAIDLMAEMKRLGEKFNGRDGVFSEVEIVGGRTLGEHLRLVRQLLEEVSGLRQKVKQSENAGTPEFFRLKRMERRLREEKTDLESGKAGYYGTVCPECLARERQEARKQEMAEKWEKTEKNLAEEKPKLYEKKSENLNNDVETENIDEPEENDEIEENLSTDENAKIEQDNSAENLNEIEAKIERLEAEIRTYSDELREAMKNPDLAIAQGISKVRRAKLTELNMWRERRREKMAEIGG